MIGAIVLSRRSPSRGPRRPERLLSGAALEASAALSRAGSHRAAEAQASTDALTGLPNRRYFDEFCGLLARRRRAGDAVGVLMVDIDKFKLLNDTLRPRRRRRGPARGRRARSSAAVREDDVPARYGGEEFVVLLRNPDPAVALEVGERVRAAVAASTCAGSASPACQRVGRRRRRRRRRTSRSTTSSRPPTGALPRQARRPRPGRRRLSRRSRGSRGA